MQMQREGEDGEKGRRKKKKEKMSVREVCDQNQTRPCTFGSHTAKVSAAVLQVGPYRHKRYGEQQARKISRKAPCVYIQYRACNRSGFGQREAARQDSFSNFQPGVKSPIRWIPSSNQQAGHVSIHEEPEKSINPGGGDLLLCRVRGKRDMCVRGSQRSPIRPPRASNRPGGGVGGLGGHTHTHTAALQCN